MFRSFNESTNIQSYAYSSGAMRNMKFHLFHSNPSGFATISLASSSPIERQASSKRTKNINSITANWEQFCSSACNDCGMKLSFGANDDMKNHDNLLRTPTCWWSYRFQNMCSYVIAELTWMQMVNHNVSVFTGKTMKPNFCYHKKGRADEKSIIFMFPQPSLVQRTAYVDLLSPLNYISKKSIDSTFLLFSDDNKVK